MPADKAGKPYELLLNPLGLITRTNPAQWAEAKLGEIARKLGRPIKVEDFDGDIDDRIAWIQDLMAQHGIPDTEDLVDPATGNAIPDVYTGTRFIMKLMHTAEDKGQGRGSGAYSADETPTKGGETGSKRIALLDSNALLSHGAIHVLRDAGSVRGQKNEDYWLQFMQGNTPTPPRVPMVYRKFVDSLKASGINVVPEGQKLHIMALTDRDIDALAGDREVLSGDTVSFENDLRPVKGGLFDPAITGGHNAPQWSAIRLDEPMPSPVMEEPIRRVLGLTQKRFEAVLAGEEELEGGTGPGAVARALGALDLDKEIALARLQVKSGAKARRDAAVRRLGYLVGAQKADIHPRDWILKRVPVLPPQFRPVAVMSGNDVPLVDDANFLYKELIEANKNLADMRKQVGDDHVGPERLAVYHAFKAVTGLGDPLTQQSQSKGIQGILKHVFGASPKHSQLQRKLISSTVDNVGRATIAPDPSLDMDQVGLPEDRAFDVYGRFIVRRLRRRGMPIAEAMRHVRDRTDLARSTLVDEMQERPIIANRAPVLHRFGVMAFKPQLTRGSVLRLSPLVVKGFGADFDGDAMQYHVPADEEARKEALDRMLPSRQLLSPADFKSPVHVPTQEYVGGLFVATSPDMVSKRPVQTFRNRRDVVEAWAAGAIGANDRVRILA